MEECLDIGAIDDILNFTYDDEPPRKALPILPFSVLDHPSAHFPAFVEEEQEEELEWISNFPPVDEYVLAGNRGAKEEEHQSPVSVLENSSSSGSGGIIMSCCGSLRVPVRARSKRGRKRSFADILSHQLWWNQQTRRAAASSITGRKCQHCGAEKTPQWRAGPSGPKTLCNACGVRYKSGRLVPEYRPASSPTFSSQLHSNSHRKIIEMRRQKQPGTPVVKPVDKG